MAITTNITNESEFKELLNHNIAIVYLLVEWSGPERLSRKLMFEEFNKWDNDHIPIFIIDCSEQKNRYVEEWLSKQKENKSDFYYGGYGETILIKKGIVIDYIKFPGQQGSQIAKGKIQEWKNN